MQQQYEQAYEGAQESQRSGLARAAGDVWSKTAEVSQQATERARQAAAQTASTVGAELKDQVRNLLDRQVGSGADIIGHVANSARRAADDLERNEPQIAGFVRGMAERMEGYAENLRGRSAEELMRAASDLARRQPALVFGLAALAGFFAFRTLRNTPSRSGASRFEPAVSPPIQPAQNGYNTAASNPDGV